MASFLFGSHAAKCDIIYALAENESQPCRFCLHRVSFPNMECVCAPGADFYGRREPSTEDRAEAQGATKTGRWLAAVVRATSHNIPRTRSRGNDTTEEESRKRRKS